MKPFASFPEALAYVQAHGEIGYQAPMDYLAVTLRASLNDDGSIELHIKQWVHDVEMGPNGYQEGPGYWEEYSRTASLDEPTGHFARLRKP